MYDMKFILTADGSKTLLHPEIGECYHSRHGALQESRHVFIRSGLHCFSEKNRQGSVAVLEVGFGTGLNFLLTADEAVRNGFGLDYCGIEAFPLPEETAFATGYGDFVSPEVWAGFEEGYLDALKTETSLVPGVQWQVATCKALDFRTEKTFDILYFDAFAAVRQPEMWTIETLAHVCQYLRLGGLFVTYAITGNLKRSMRALGFEIEKIPGPPGKREMLRGVKLKSQD